MNANVSQDLSRGEHMLIWALEALADVLPPETVKAWAWGIDGKKLIAEARASAGTATETEIGAIALTQSFLDELRTTLKG